MHCDSEESTLSAWSSERTKICDKSKDDAFIISNNPLNDILTINTTENLNQVRIYNLNGQCLIKNNFSFNDNSVTEYPTINVSSLPHGVYIINAITISGSILQAKFIKE